MNINNVIFKIQSYFIFVILLIFPTLIQAQLGEYEIKALFLERFTRFVEWPEDVQNDSSSNHFAFGVIGINPFGSILDEMYSIQKIKEKRRD